jgi:UDP-glucose 4-epimerase
LRPINVYGITKLLGERICQKFSSDDLALTIVRLTNTYGPRDFGRVIPAFIGRAVKNEPLILYGGDQVLDLLWIDAAIDALLSVAGPGNEVSVVNIGSGKGTSIVKLAERIIEMTNSKSAINYEPRRAIEVSSFVADVALAKEYIGWEPPTDPLSRLEDVLHSLQ